MLTLTLTDEVGDRLKGLLLAHDEADLLLCAVTHKLGVANAALLPLLVAPAEKLGPDLHDALEVLLSALCRYRRDVHLCQTKTIESTRSCNTRLREL